MLKKIFSIFLIMSFISVWADELKVEINPLRPVKGEVFQAVFRVYTESDEEPSINFSQYKIEVVGKSNQGITTRTIYSNGRLSTSREITVVYDLLANEHGSAGLRDIVAIVGGKTLRHPSINLTVLKEPEVLQDVFLMADVPKKRLFLGEGVVVRYFLYHRIPVSNFDIKKYPKLDKFLKRFLQEPERSERVSVNGEIYTRTLLYAAKLFPEKAGELKIDSLQMGASVMISRANDPFGGFGLGREMKNKTLSSEVIKLEVLPLPELGRPLNFTGLVGRHLFDLNVGQSKLIVNEPLEIKLTVSGGGALENMEAPNLLQNEAFEDFESNGDLKINNAEDAVKTFEYTYLAKSPVDLAAKTIVLSYFDPDSEKYVPVELPFPGIKVVGGGQVKSDAPKAKEKNDKQERDNQPVEIPSVINKPIIEYKNFLNWKSWLDYLNLALLVLAFVFLISMLVRAYPVPRFWERSSIPAQFKQGQFDLGGFLRWIDPIIVKKGASPLVIIRSSTMSEAARTYFIDLLTSNEYKDYSSTKSAWTFKYEPRYFIELDDYIRCEVNEDLTRTA